MNRPTEQQAIANIDYDPALSVPDVATLQELYPDVLDEWRTEPPVKPKKRRKSNAFRGNRNEWIARLA